MRPEVVDPEGTQAKWWKQLCAYEEAGHVEIFRHMLNHWASLGWTSFDGQPS